MTNPNDPYNQGGYNQGGQPQQPGYPQQQPGYPQQGGYPPAAPPLSQSELNAPARPKSVDTAYLLWLIAAGIGILANLIGFFTAEALAKQTLESLNLDASGVEIEPSYGSLIFSLAISLVWILVVMQMRKGANWARILLTVLGGLSILFGLIGLLAIGLLFAIGAMGAIQGLLGVAQLAVIIGAIVFMFKSDSNYYFKAS